MITKKEAAVIAAKKTVELFGLDNLRKYGGWFSVRGNIYVQSVAKLHETKPADNGTAPTIDETKPWKEVTDIFVDMETGEITVDTRYNVTIFD